MIRVLVVDDEPGIRQILAQALKLSGYEVMEAENGKKALEKLQEKPVDIMIMDIQMPEMDGLTATKKIREMRLPVFIIMLTAFNDEKMVKEAVKAGADDFIAKPVDLKLLLARLELARKNLSFHKFRALFKVKLFSQLKIKEETIKKLQQANENLLMETLNIMYKMAEIRDYETSEHALKVGWISGRIAEKMGAESDRVAEIQFAAPLHDIGKIGIPDRILLKPGKLTDEEFETMKQHTVIGYEILSNSSASLLKTAAKIALCHHERWDGTGYPQGIKGKEIPLEAAITAVADSFDAIVSKRPYKEAKPLDFAFEEIKKLSGKWYHPEVVEAFLEIEEEVRDQYKSFASPEMK